jgi:hypothetical protein
MAYLAKAGHDDHPSGDTSDSADLFRSCARVRPNCPWPWSPTPRSRPSWSSRAPWQRSPTKSKCGLRQAAVIMVGEALHAEEFDESHLYGKRRR